LGRPRGRSAAAGGASGRGEEPAMGDIGTERREVEFEPLPDAVPQPAPAPAPAPAPTPRPERTPA
jgi:hypothetical protein